MRTTVPSVKTEYLYEDRKKILQIFIFPWELLPVMVSIGFQHWLRSGSAFRNRIRIQGANICKSLRNRIGNTAWQSHKPVLLQNMS